MSPEPAPEAAWARGIDVSSYQPAEDWNAVKAAGISRVYVKATEGATWADPAFVPHIQGARQAGLEVGAYHFWRPNDDPLRQAQWFLRTGGWTEGWQPPVLDVEFRGLETNVEAQAAIAAWLEFVSARTGPCRLYTSPAWWRALGDPQHFRLASLWIAHYGVAAPDVPGRWADWDGWQYTNAGTVPGISGPVDLTYWKH